MLEIINKKCLYYYVLTRSDQVPKRGQLYLKAFVKYFKTTFTHKLYYFKL